MQKPTQPQTEQEADDLAERFFSQPPEAWEVTDEPEPWRPAPLTKGERLAMLATVMPIAIGASVAIGLFVFSDPLFASAEPGEPAQERVAAAAPSPVDDAAQHGLTALAKASPITVAPPDVDAPPEMPAAMQVVAAPQVAASQVAASQVAAPQVAAQVEPSAGAPSSVAAAASTARSTSRAAVPATRSAAPTTAAAAVRAQGTGSPLARARKALDAGKPQDARALATEAIGRNPNAAAAYIVLAGALDALGDRAGMQATFRTCAERATDSLASACRSLVR